MRFTKPKDFTAFQHCYIYKLNGWLVLYGLTLPVIAALATIPALMLMLISPLFALQSYCYEKSRYFYMKHPEKVD